MQLARGGAGVPGHLPQWVGWGVGGGDGTGECPGDKAAGVSDPGAALRLQNGEPGKVANCEKPSKVFSSITQLMLHAHTYCLSYLKLQTDH